MGGIARYNLKYPLKILRKYNYVANGKSIIHRYHLLDQHCANVFGGIFPFYDSDLFSNFLKILV